MKGRLGPLDQRRNVTRCMACARRRIKCQGGTPCEYCTRISKPCRPQLKPTSTTLHFISFTVPKQVSRPHDEIYLDYFSSFLDGCKFTSGFVSVASDLVPLLSASRNVLRRAAVAIGALSASRRGVGENHGRGAEKVAFECYGVSVRGLKQRLVEPGAVEGEDVLWTTFLLGLFELLSEPSGEQWQKHMLYGTARILQLRGPTSSASALHEKLLEAFRVLEANRVILYGEESFVSRDRYESVRGGVLEGMLGLVVDVAAFSKKFFQVVEDTPAMERFFHPNMHTLAHEGILMQHRIHHWKNSILSTPQGEDGDIYTQLAMSYHHALLLLLSRNYTFYPCWHGLSIPSLTPGETSHSTMEIMRLVERISSEGEVPSVVLLFPLRMAGAHAMGQIQSEEIVRLLRRVYQGGFVVADRIVVDLRDLWAEDGILMNQ